MGPTVIIYMAVLPCASVQTQSQMEMDDLTQSIDIPNTNPNSPKPAIMLSLPRSQQAARPRRLEREALRHQSLDMDDHDVHDHDAHDDSRSQSPHLPATAFRLFTLTVALLGLQLAWAVELAYGTPYLLSLGMDKAWTSLVWLAGPLSGLLVQPIVGALSDTSTMRLGRRRPFLLLGTAASLVSMALVALSRPLGGSSSVSGPGASVTTLTIAIAVVGFYLLDFAVNTVQAASRALIVDVMHPNDQALANAVAGAMVCLGNVIGYAAGLVDWPRVVGIAPTPAAQFQLVCSVASIALVCAVAVTVVCTPEVPNEPSQTHRDNNSRKSWMQVLVGPLVAVAKAIPNMPQVAVHVCLIQVCCWLGWFPFLFYSTTWVAQYTTNSHFPFDGPDAAHATRQGSLAFFAFSLVALVVATLLPGCTRRFALPLGRVWMAGEALFAVTLALGTLLVSGGRSASLVITLTGGAWAVGMWVPMALLGQVVSQATAASAVGAAAPGRADGYQRVPMLRAASASDCTGPAMGKSRIRRGRPGGTSQEYLVVHSSDEQEDEDLKLPKCGVEGLPKPHHQASSPSLTMDPAANVTASSSAATLVASTGGGARTRSQSVSDFRHTGHKHTHVVCSPPLDPAAAQPTSHLLGRPSAAVPAAGIVLGLHNVAIVLPQLLVSVVAAGLFAMLPDGKGKPMVPGALDDAIGWLFRLGGVAAGVAVGLIWRLLPSEVGHGEEEIRGA